jgi:hypothetical protein
VGSFYDENCGFYTTAVGLSDWTTLNLADATTFDAGLLISGAITQDGAGIISIPVTPPGGDDGIREGAALAWPMPAAWLADGTQLIDLRLDNLIIPAPAATTIVTSIGVRTSVIPQATWQGRCFGYSDDAAGPRARVVATSTSARVSGTSGTGAPLRVETVFVPSRSTNTTVALSCSGRLVCATTRTTQLADAFDNDLVAGEQALLVCVTAPTASTARVVGGRARYRIVTFRNQADT